MCLAAPWRPVQNWLRAADHPHIVDLKEVMASKDKIYMVMEFMPGGELFDKIVADGPLEEDVARRVFQQLLDALDYCHKRSIFHRSGRWPQYVVPSYLAAGPAEAAYILQDVVFPVGSGITGDAISPPSVQRLASQYLYG